MRLVIAAVGVSVVAGGIQLFFHPDGPLSLATEEPVPDGQTSDVIDAISARERRGSLMAIEAGIDRARLALSLSPSRILSSRLAELITERGRLRGDFSADDVVEANAALKGPLDDGARAALLMGLGDLEAAAAIFPKNPVDARSRSLLAEIVASTDPARAEKLLRRKAEELGTRPLRALAAARLAQGDVEGALLVLDERLLAVPDDVTARSMRARARYDIGDVVAARADVNQALVKGELALEPMLALVRFGAADPATKPTDLDGTLALLRPFAQRHPAAVAAARLDALRLAQRHTELTQTLAQAGGLSGGFDFQVARAAALLALGHPDEALATLADVQVGSVPVTRASRVLALRLASSKVPNVADAQLFAQIRPASSVAVLAFALHTGSDAAAALPFMVARPLAILDDDERVLLSSLAPTDPFAAFVVTRLRTGTSNGTAAFEQKNLRDPRVLVLAAQRFFEQGAAPKAQKTLLMLQAQPDLSSDVINAGHILSARIFASLGRPAEANAQLQGLPQDGAALLVGAEVDTATGDLAAARTKLESLRLLDVLDRSALRKLRSLP